MTAFEPTIVAVHHCALAYAAASYFKARNGAPERYCYDLSRSVY